MKLEIEKGVAFTGEYRGSGPTIRSQLRTMEVGDSFLVKNEKYRTTIANAYNVARHSNKKFAGRKAEGEYHRIWRTA